MSKTRPDTTHATTSTYSTAVDATMQAPLTMPIAEAARILGVSRAHVHRLMGMGEIGFLLLNDSSAKPMRLPLRSEFDAYVSRQTVVRDNRDADA